MQKIKVEFARWPLITAGECEPRKGLIRINLTALDAAAKAGVPRDLATQAIIAHELGHLLRAGQGETDADCEAAAHAFAAHLLQCPALLEKLADIWRKERDATLFRH